ncbi:MAG: hypothetical protein LBI28_01210 [Treponema sp.]|jgi:hypothetical protein|nr:hypothetical protein [Treponema sp.]
MTERRLIANLVLQYSLSMSVPAFIGLFYTVEPIKEAVINFIENKSYSETTLRMLLNNNTSQTVVSKSPIWINGISGKKVTYDIENYLDRLKR